MARPTKYMPETAAKIEQALRLGATHRIACAYAGISEDTFAVWRRRYPDFSELVPKAEGAACVGWLAKIEKAANDGAWQAAAWKLERRYPQEFGRRLQEVTGPNGTPLQVDATVNATVAVVDARDKLLAMLAEVATHRAAGSALSTHEDDDDGGAAGQDDGEG